MFVGANKLTVRQKNPASAQRIITNYWTTAVVDVTKRETLMIYTKDAAAMIYQGRT